jgi:hypothetical protein
LITTLYKTLKSSDNRFFSLTCIILYSVSFELPGRIAAASPYIPYELGKYLFFILLITGIFLGYRRGLTGLFMLLFLLPALFIDISGQVWFKNIVFNILGPVNLSLAVIFFSKQQISSDDLIKALRLLIYTAVMVLSYITIKKPDFSDVVFSLVSNFETSGGWGPNQVSTLTGLGAFLMFLFLKNRWHLTGSRWLDFMIFVLFIFRGLMTFSRGGMLGAAIGILIIMLFDINLSVYNKFTALKRILVRSATVILLIYVLFAFADNITGGNLFLRYKGETPATLAGYREKDLNVLTANRLKVFEDDLILWQKHILLGNGVGSSYYLRESTKGIAAHVEISRLLSEHGVLGLFYFLLLIYIGLRLYGRIKEYPYGAVLFAIFVLALFTTFHSAMRTYISPLLIGISLLNITEIPEETNVE